MDKLEALKDELKATEAKLEDLQTKIKELEQPSFNFSSGAILVNNLGFTRIFPSNNANVSLFSVGSSIVEGTLRKDRVATLHSQGYRQLTPSQVRQVFDLAASFYNKD